MDWLQFVKEAGDAPFKAGMLIAMIYGVRQLGQMKESMEKLHRAIAVVVERVSSHEKRITSLERKKR
jgi:hypothetical protein